MLQVLSYMNQLLETDSELSGMIATYENQPAIAFQVAPEDMLMPYVVTRVEANTLEENQVTDRMLYAVDIFVDNGDIELVLAISNRIKKILGNECLPKEVGIGIWRLFEHVVPDPDPGIQHIHLKFMVRFMN